MGGSCGTDGKEEQCKQDFLGQAERKGHLEDLGVDERMILKWTYKK
jgi:hypothetical protein